MLQPQAEADPHRVHSVGPPEFARHQANRQRVTVNWPTEVTDRDHNRLVPYYLFVFLILTDSVCFPVSHLTDQNIPGEAPL